MTLPEARARLQQLWPSIAQRASGLPLSPEQRGRPAPRKLRLVEDEEMQVWLARSEALRRVEREAREPWHALQAMLAELQPLGLTPPLDRLSAEGLFDALLEAMREAGLEAPLQQLVMRCAARPNALDLPGLYRELERTLRRCGLEPGAGRTGRAPLSPARPDPQPSTPQAAAAALEEPSSPTPSVDPGARPPAGTSAAIPARSALQTAHRLWSLSPTALQPQARPGEGVDDRVLQEAVQQVVREGATRRFRERLLEVSAERSGGVLRPDPRQAEALELLGRLHEALHQDPLLPTPFRSWTAPLMAPLLGTQLRQEGLDEAGETLRRLFDALEFAATMCSQREDATTRRLRAQVDAIVERLANQTSLGPPELDDAVDEIDRLLQRHRQARSTLEERVVEACRGQQTLVDARRAVDQALNERFAQRPLPAALATMLDGPLYDLLVLTVLREGGEGPGWQQRLAGLDQLLHAACLDDPEARVRGAEAALQAVLPAEGLDALGAELEGLRNALGDRRGDAERRIWPGRQAPAPPTLDATDPAVQTLRLVRPGDWFAFDLDRPEPRLLKLAWHAADRRRFVFVNPLGHKAEDLEDQALLALLRAKRARLLEDGASTAIERAWRRMLEGLHDELAIQACHDPLTGLPNRKELERRLQAWVRGAERPPLALLWVAADRQRVLNQTLGMEGGDQALRALAGVLEEAARAHGDDAAFAARVAGDEFVLVLSRCNAARAEQAAHGLHARLASMDLHWQDRRYRLSASVGIVVADEDCSDLEALLRDAESACGVAKELGGGRCYIHRADDFRIAQMRETVAWLGRIEESLDQGLLVLYGQRALSLSERARSGPEYLEVLLRMRDGHGGVTSPQHFVIAAERYGQIAAIDHFVIEQLCLHLIASEASSRFRVAFNLSAHNLVDRGFVDRMLETLRKLPQPAGQIAIELTETAAIQDLAAAADAMQRLSEAGLTLVLDDFGSGWASYSYLSRLPVDIVKVDGAFIREIARNPRDFALARSLNEVAHMLGKLTVAEHVEDAQTLERLREIGFDYAQGYLHDTPRPLTVHLD
ncbi:MAG: hypothetical protein KatS3mg126_1814 [Lysobacteraceae bacterium]|nr:MAG: hypothetical protein KatS3mg126_1814 [Xanthomonadaceae bacterium]